MFALSRAKRNAVAGAAVCAFAGAFALLPTRAGGRLATATVPLRSLHDTQGTVVPVVMPLRDPFAPPAGDSLESVPAVPNALSGLARLGPLPPNARAGPFPFSTPPPAARLLAIVVGPQPRALIDENGHSRLVAVGARLGAARIRAIDPDGVSLDDGRRLTLARTDGERR